GPSVLKAQFDSSSFAVVFKSGCTVDGLNGNSGARSKVSVRSGIVSSMKKLQDMPLRIKLLKSNYTPRPLPPRESLSPPVPPPEPNYEVDMNHDTFLPFPSRGDNPGSAAVHLGAPTSVESDWNYDSELCTSEDEAENLQSSMDVDLLSEKASGTISSASNVCTLPTKNDLDSSKGFEELRECDGSSRESGPVDENFQLIDLKNFAFILTPLTAALLIAEDRTSHRRGRCE
ncbi:hypothetical protein B0H11DRAFT_2352937, partial [Mycena galericulata]